MCHAKGDGVLKAGEDGSVGTEARCATFAQCELAIGFEEANRRDFDASIAEGFEFQFLLICGEVDVTDGFVFGGPVGESRPARRNTSTSSVELRRWATVAT
jgi:hypothetical protein